MSTVITATLDTDKPTYVAQDVITVTATDLQAIQTASANGEVSVVFTAEDGTTYTVTSSPVPVTSAKSIPVKMSSISFKNSAGVVTEGTISTAGNSGTVTAS